MSKLRRYYKEGGVYFVTIVTQDRKQLFLKYSNLLLETLNHYCERLKFDIIAFIIMPDHIHIIIDPKNNNLSSILQKIKLSFSKKVRFKLSKTDGKIWQSRFWDHLIRNQEDLNRHIDYIHYNPVKHGYKDSPFDWNDSSIHSYFTDGYYQEDWGNKKIEFGNADFGE